MDSNLLRVFVAVASEGSVTLGAARLGSAQSNVTARIKQLEKNLGFGLFHRVPQGVILTDKGKALYPEALEIVAKLDKLDARMRGEIAPRLKIVSTEANATVRGVAFMLALRKKYPNIELELVTTPTCECLKMVRAYEADAAFASVRLDADDKDLTALNVFEETMTLASPKNGAPEVFVVFREGCAYNDFTKKYMKERGLEWPLLRFASYETILGCVEAGLGRAILPLSIIEKLGYKDKLNLTELSKEEADIPTSLICRKDNLPSIEKFIRKMKI